MKTTSKILSTGIVLIILITGCKKNQSSSITEQKVTFDGQKIESVVKYCTARMNSHLKSNDSILIDSLTYYLEAGTNYTYGISSAKAEFEKIDSNFFTITLCNEKVALNDLRNTYATAIDSVRASYRRIQDNNKNLLAVMVKIKSQKNNVVNIKVTSIILYGGNFQVGSFDTTDYWLWWNMGGNNGGKCGPYSGQTSLDAAIKLQQHIMLRKGVSPGCYVPPFQDVQFDASDFSNPYHTGSNCYFWSYFFYNAVNWPCAHDCLMPFEMRWYLTGAEFVCNTSNTAYPRGARPDGLTFMSIFLTGDIMYGGPPNFYDVYIHRGNIYYGTYLQGGYQSSL